MFCFTATTHFNGLRDDMIRMVPPMMPNPAFLLTLTGVSEVPGEIGLLVPRTRRVAAVALILLAIRPANIDSAISGVTIRGAPPTPLFLGILRQLFLARAVWRSGVHAAEGRGLWSKIFHPEHSSSRHYPSSDPARCCAVTSLSASLPGSGQRRVAPDRYASGTNFLRIVGKNSVTVGCTGNASRST